MKKTLFQRIRDSVFFRINSMVLAMAFLFQIFYPGIASALTSGPGQEEFASFEPAGTSDMVDLYSGDFTYNIPLLSLPGPNGGYPINLAYHSGVGMDQEASWVGLGWNLNVGAINRQLRGLPDDFNGDAVTQTMHLKSGFTVGVDIPNGRKREFFGFPAKPETALSPLNCQLYYNSYKGIGYRVFMDVPMPKRLSDNPPYGLGISYDSQNGMNIEPKLSLSALHGWMDVKVGIGISSQSGLQGFSFSYNINKKAQTHNTPNVAGPEIQKSEKLGGIGLSSSISFSTSQSVPSVSIPMRTDISPFDIKFSAAGAGPIWGNFGYGGWTSYTGFVSTMEVADEGISQNKGYGYIYSVNSTVDTDLKDFQRDYLPYSKNVPNLAPCSFTYDIFSVSGQGAGGMFRPYVSGVGILFNPARINQENSYRSNIEYGVGGGAASHYHIGAGFSMTKGETRSGNWQQVGSASDNELESVLGFGTSTGDPRYEKFYFQNYGEKSGTLYGSGAGEDQLSLWDGDKAVRAKLEYDNDPDWSNRQFVARKKFIEKQGGSDILTANNDNVNRFTTGATNQRVRRTSNIEYTTDGNSHIETISTLQPDGMRYIYGLPVKNKSQLEATFSVAGSSDHLTAIIPVSGGKIDPSIVNNSDEYLKQTELPEYTHSWLLTAVLGADYVDLNGDGPSNDDYGYWVKFNYTKVQSGTEYIYDDYKWRVPYTGSSYIEGYKNNPMDDKGTFSYGVRELYYISSAETKTHKVVFNTSKRKDGMEAYGALNGSTREAKMRRLNSISLFVKTDMSNPLKSVNFKYSYDLCPNVPNNSGVAENETVGTGTVDHNALKGKLTLTKLSFTGGNSTRGELSPYVFHYATNDDYTNTTENPPYNNHNVDRWGNFNPNSDYPAHYPYLDLPYVEQDPLHLANSAAWSLKKIDLPSGGSIQVNYEPDDYAYVENQKATRMFDIQAIELTSSTPSGFMSGADRWSSGAIVSCPTEPGSTPNIALAGATPENYRIYFQMETPYPGTAGGEAAYIASHYLGDNNKVFFKIYADLMKDGENSDGVDARDYVTGYADPDPSACGIKEKPITGGTSTTGSSIGYITLKAEKLSKKNISGIYVCPFTKAAIQHLKANRPELAHHAQPYCNSALSQITNLVASAPQLITEAEILGIGFNHWAYTEGHGQMIQLNGLSVIKLNDPNGSKFGGGTRVKNITINDNWVNSDPSIDRSSYGLEYSYLMDDGSSSGVAYEPRMGGEESALRKPVEYVNSTFLGSAYALYVEKPLMESFYPGAGVGYRKVSVKSMAPDIADLKDNGFVDNSNRVKYSVAPQSIYEFYTAKDFPVMFDETDINPEKPIIRPLMIPGVYSSYKKRKARSQGYSIVMNDMPGKLKGITKMTRVDGTGTASKVISKEEYIYYTEAPYSPDIVNKLSSKVQVLTSDGEYRTALIGQSHDIYIDENEDLQKSKTRGGDLNSDIEAGVAALVPYVLFSIVPFPTLGDVNTSMRTIVTHKVIYRTGIVKEVIRTQNESVVKTDNIAFDLYTGEPILTKTYNDFNDPVYDYSYPAHWYYANMGAAYQNYGLVLTGLSTSSSGRITVANPEKYFTRGDEIKAGSAIYTVAKVTPGPLGYINCIDASGGYASFSSQDIKIIRSGYKNLLTAKAGALQAKDVSVPACNAFSTTNNYVTSATSYSIAADKIIHATAVEYSDQWQLDCGSESAYCTTDYGKFLPAFLNLLMGSSGSPLAMNHYTSSSPATITASSEFIDDIYSGCSGTKKFYTSPDSYDPHRLNIHFFCGTEELNCSAYIEVPDGDYSFSDIISTYSLFSLFYANPAGDELDFSGTITVEGVPIQAYLHVKLCHPCDGTTTSCGLIPGTDVFINPYKKGVNGIWRPKKSYAYVVNRIYADNDISKDGLYASFVPFDWLIPTNNNPTSWVLANTITKYSPQSFELENKDPIGNFSAALYGYGNSLVTAIGSNAKYHELGTSGFEDDPGNCSDDHFRFTNIDGSLSNAFSHTGKYSLRVLPGLQMEMDKSVVDLNCDAFETDVNDELYTPDDYPKYHIHPCDCKGKFAPTASKKFVISGWVHEDVPVSSLITYPDAKIILRFFAGGTQIGSDLNFTASDNIIDGWQRIFGTFDVPGTADAVKIFVKNTGNHFAYFDDLRIHPFSSNMKSFVYDPKSLRLTAELDENNYATIYVYDEEGKLTKIKKETAEGIKTVREGRLYNKIQ